MAEPVVSITLETLRNVLVEEARFYCGVRSQVMGIQLELQRMCAFLKDADSKQDSDERVFNWVSQVREAAYDVEDNVLVFIAAKTASRNSRNSRNVFKKMVFFFKEIVTTYRVGSHISDIKIKIADLTTGLQTYGIKSGEGVARNNSRVRDLRKSYSHVVEEDFVGLEEEIKMLVAHLIDEQRERERVVSIHGMGGIGKTTIARKLYSHRDVRMHFDGFAWACITQKWEKKDVMQGILIN
ncbi:hypothetical protein ACS0TY_023500 [Phlomoides rotata]